MGGVYTAQHLENLPGRKDDFEIILVNKENYFVFQPEYRGAIAAKNKGEIEMYFVNRIRPELARDSDGNMPNEKFLELYRQVKTDSSLANRVSSRM
jgi:hypothetical protein